MEVTDKSEKEPPFVVKHKPRKCPLCKGTRIASYQYGLPAFSEKLEKDLREGRVVLGGCNVDPENPRWRCVSCGTDFATKMETLEEYVQRFGGKNE